MDKLRGWNDLGVVDTIYEEEDHEDISTSPSLSLTISLPPTPLHSRVEAWSLATGCVTNVLIKVQGSHFSLHKGPMAARSSYLKRHLNDSSEITLSPPLNITPETFTLIADFCYGVHILISPFNVAGLRVAAELLEMTETEGVTADENLRQKTEAYFRRAIALSREYALIVLRSCLSLLPQSETTAALPSRCIEALSLFDDGDAVIMSCIDDIEPVQPEDFLILAESLKSRFSGSHDLLYRIVDLYLKEHGGKITEDQKTQICNTIDCTALSPQVLMHAVQNPQMPLRFVVQAMFVDQLNTRRSIASAADHHQSRRYHRPPKESTGVASLGTIFQRDAEIRKAAQLKAEMDATSSRVEFLEKELDGMKKRLHESENRRSEPVFSRTTSYKSNSDGKIGRGRRASVSSSGFQNFPRRGNNRFSTSSTASADGISPRSKKSFGQKLLGRLKSAFWMNEE